MSFKVLSLLFPKILTFSLFLTSKKRFDQYYGKPHLEKWLRTDSYLKQDYSTHTNLSWIPVEMNYPEGRCLKLKPMKTFTNDTQIIVKFKDLQIKQESKSKETHKIYIRLSGIQYLYQSGLDV